ncbi:MAG: hypothetical protein V4450_15640 [Bacteroidota bacterium]
MPKTVLFLALYLLAHTLFAQNFAGKWEGDGFYVPGQAITTVMQKMGGRKKLFLEINPSGTLTGSLITSFDKSRATILNDGGDQAFTIAGKIDKQLLLLIVTHTKGTVNSSEPGISFQKPDSVYYAVELAKQGNRTILNGSIDKKLNRNSSAEWVGSSQGSGMGMNISDNISMHLLPLNIMLENISPAIAPKPMTATVIAPLDPNTPRKTEIQRTIVLDTSFIQLAIYDNGEIDGDIASLLLDGQMILSNQLLSAKAATLSLNLSKQPEHILELFANNLGSIPPNTALLVLTCNQKRYEIFLSSNGTVNGSVKLIFKPK